MVERVLAVPEVRGSIPGLGRFRVYHFRNVQHNTKVPISYMVAQVGIVLLPYGPGLVSWETYVLLRPYVWGRVRSMTSITSGTIGGGAARCGASIVTSTEMRYTTNSRRTTEKD